MGKIYKNHGKSLLTAGLFTVASFCWLPIDVFSASEATRRLIHETLAKYGISSGGKRVCGTDEEPKYDKNTETVRCYNNGGYYRQNCWDRESRLCKPCPLGSVVNKYNHIYCHKIVCPEGYELVEIKNDQCPEGFEIKEFTENCDSETYIFDEMKATNNYATQSTNCKNIN